MFHVLDLFIAKKIIPGIQCNIFEIFHKLSHTPLDKHEPHVISLFYSYFRIVEFDYKIYL